MPIGIFRRNGLPEFIGGVVRFLRNAIGTTTTSAITLENEADAASGAQQYSPGLSQIGRGWETDTGSSMLVEIRWELRPVQGAAAPTFNYVLMGRVDGGAWLELQSQHSGGNVSFPNGHIEYALTGQLRAGTTGARIEASGPSGVGVFTFYNSSAQTAGLRFQFAAAPTVASGFGTSPAITAGSTDTAGQIDVGTGGTASSGVINFATTWASAPFVVAMNQTNGVVLKASATTTQLTITGSAAWAANDKINWICIGAQA